MPLSTVPVLLLLLAVALLAMTVSPLAALAGTAAAAFLAVAAARVDLAMLLLVTTAPLEAAIVISSNPEITIVKLLGLVTFGGFAANLLLTRRRLTLTWTHAMVFGFLVVALVSTLQARDDTLALSTTLRYASFAGLYLVISQVAQDDRLLRRVVWCLSVAAAIGALWGIQRFVAGETLAAATPNGDPNDDAFTWITTIPLTLWLLGATKARVRLLAVPMAGALAAATLFSLSRGALVGLAAGILWEVLVERRHLRLFLAAAVFALLASFYVLNTNPEQLEISLSGKEKVAAQNVESRLDAWRVAVDLAVRHPVLGVGPGNFRVLYPEEAGRPPGSESIGPVHNAYLDIAAELGPLGLALFMAYLVGAFSQLSAARGHGVGPPGLAAAARTSLVVASVAALFLSEQYFQPFWLLGGLGAALWAMGLRSVPEPR